MGVAGAGVRGGGVGRGDDVGGVVRRRDVGVGAGMRDRHVRRRLGRVAWASRCGGRPRGW